MEGSSKSYTLAEVAKIFFPNQVLQRLERSLCEHFDLHYDHQHSLRNTLEEPLLGTVEIAKRSWVDKDYVNGLVKDFYKTEGYEIDDKNGIRVKNDKNQCDVFILETDTSIMIHVTKSILQP